jgi:sterol desaturase/sphingolipid hydroxylase (fatty acid hydroxylase superfamily)
MWDMVFGTFENPPTFDDEAGFYDGASRRNLDMLLGRDLSEPLEENAPATVSNRRAA